MTERAAFEAWAREYDPYLYLERSDTRDGYIGMISDTAWKAWQAAAAQARAQALEEAANVVDDALVVNSGYPNYEDRGSATLDNAAAEIRALIAAPDVTVTDYGNMPDGSAGNQCRYPLCQSEAEQDRIAAEVYRQLHSGEPSSGNQDAIDAARFRWLAKNSFDVQGITQFHVWQHTWEPHSQTGEPTEWKCRVRGASLVRAIDATMAQKGGDK
jgi:hypothetical protein